MGWVKGTCDCCGETRSVQLCPAGADEESLGICFVCSKEAQNVVCNHEALGACKEERKALAEAQADERDEAWP